MMYTTGNGERRLRVINYRYPIVNNIEVLYEAVDYLAFSNVLFLLFTAFVSGIFKQVGSKSILKSQRGVC